MSTLSDSSDQSQSQSQSQDDKDYQTNTYESCMKLLRNGYFESVKNTYERFDFPFDSQNGNLVCIMILRNDLEKVKYFMEHPNRKIQIHCRNNVILRSCCKWGRLEILKYIVSLGLKTNSINLHFDTDQLLLRTIQGGNLEVLKFLISLGIDIYACENTDYKCCKEQPLIEAINANQFHIAKYLMDLGMNIDNCLIPLMSKLIIDRRSSPVHFCIVRSSNAFGYIRTQAPESPWLENYYEYYVTHKGKCKYFYSKGALANKQCSKNTKHDYCNKHN